MHQSCSGDILTDLGGVVHAVVSWRMTWQTLRPSNLVPAERLHVHDRHLLYTSLSLNTYTCTGRPSTGGCGKERVLSAVPSGGAAASPNTNQWKESLSRCCGS